MEDFATIDHSLKPLTIATKLLILDVCKETGTPLETDNFSNSFKLLFLYLPVTEEIWAFATFTRISACLLEVLTSR